MKNLNEKLEVLGVLLNGFNDACVNLNIIVGSMVKELTNNINDMEWYNLKLFEKMQVEVIYKKNRILFLRRLEQQ